MNARQRRTTIVAGALALTLIAGACGGDDSATGGSGGEVFVTGSSTVEPISIRVAEKAKDRGVTAVVEGPGTGDGFKKFCVGDGDVTGASRPIKDEEAATCAANGVDYVELAIGIDGLTVATSVENTAVTCLDVPALYALLGPESEGFKRWSDADDLAAELGSRFTDLPDEPLSISGPGEESGTYDSFVEFAVKAIAQERGTDEWLRADYASSSNDNLVIEGIEGADTSIGWVGYAYYKAESERMKAIEIADDSGTCVPPTDETIAQGTYRFSRVLYIYVNSARALADEGVRDYVDLYLSDDGISSVTEAGYVAEPADRLQAARDAWAAVS